MTGAKAKPTTTLASASSQPALDPPHQIPA